MFCQYTARERVNFTERRGFEPAGSLQAKTKAAYAAE